MKRFASLFALFTLSAGTLLPFAPAFAQVAAAPPLLSYQGRLAIPDGNPVPDGTYEIRFSLWDAVSDGNEKWNQTLSNVQVKNGSFAVLLNTNTAGLFNGNLWLETKIGTDAALTPRQQLVSVAYAMKANSVPDASIGTTQIANNGITAAKIADGAVTSAKLASGAINSLAWLLGGNSGTSPASQFFGTTDNQPLAFRTNNTEQMRLLANGRLGIGDTTPGSRLEVGVSAAGDGIRVTGTGAGGPQISLYNDSTYGGGLGLALGAGQYSTNAAINDTVLRTNLASSKLLLQNSSGAAAMSIVNNKVGIGTTSPANPLSVNGIANFTQVGIGTATPSYALDVDGVINASSFIFGELGIATTLLVTTSDSTSGTKSIIENTSAGGKSWTLLSAGSGNAEGAGTLGFQVDNTRVAQLKPTGEFITKVVTVTGGSDVAEPYYVAPAGEVKPLPGMVVCLDETKIGQMKVASGAYNTTVAGIISGANGIRPGLTLTQKGTIADGDMPIASIGRVWCWCDADANGAIKVGNMLTTSDTPGYAMKVTDFGRANGAVIGKAMSNLASGKGLVLVLVSLK